MNLRTANGSKASRPIRLAAGIILATTLLSIADGAPARLGEYAAPVELAVVHWFRVQQPNGFFPYAFNFLEDAAAESDLRSAANLGRQAGTAAVLADYYVLTGDPRAAVAVERLIAAVGRHSLPIGESSVQPIFEWTRVLSIPVGRFRLRAALDRLGLLFESEGPGKVISPNSDYQEAYTGIGALALIAELRYFHASRSSQFADLRRAWVEGLLALRIPGDGFRVSPTSIDSTPYFDGESWLALAEYRRSFPDDSEIDILLADLDEALIRKYGARYSQDFFHWGAMAAAARYLDTKDPKFVDFLRGQLTQFLARHEKRRSSGNNCAYIEGVADAMGALQSAGLNDSALIRRARRWTASTMVTIRQLQIQQGQQELAFSNARIIAPRMQEYAGAFRSGLYEADTQVDYTAHCVSAMLKLARHGIDLHYE